MFAAFLDVFDAFAFLSERRVFALLLNLLFQFANFSANWLWFRAGLWEHVAALALHAFWLVSDSITVLFYGLTQLADRVAPLRGWLRRSRVTAALASRLTSRSTTLRCTTRRATVTLALISSVARTAR